MAESDGTPRSFLTRVEDELRTDVAADERLVRELIAELVEKVETLEKRIITLERGPQN